MKQNRRSNGGSSPMRGFVLGLGLGVLAWAILAAIVAAAIR